MSWRVLFVYILCPHTLTLSKNGWTNPGWICPQKPRCFFKVDFGTLVFLFQQTNCSGTRKQDAHWAVPCPRTYKITFSSSVSEKKCPFHFVHHVMLNEDKIRWLNNQLQRRTGFRRRAASCPPRRLPYVGTVSSAPSHAWHGRALTCNPLTESMSPPGPLTNRIKRGENWGKPDGDGNDIQCLNNTDCEHTHTHTHTHTNQEASNVKKGQADGANIEHA